jgi:hypothetical protein
MPKKKGADVPPTAERKRPVSLDSEKVAVTCWLANGLGAQHVLFRGVVE